MKPDVSCYFFPFYVLGGISTNSYILLYYLKTLVPKLFLIDQVLCFSNEGTCALHITNPFMLAHLWFWKEKFMNKEMFLKFKILYPFKLDPC